MNTDDDETCCRKEEEEEEKEKRERKIRMPAWFSANNGVETLFLTSFLKIMFVP